MPNLLQETENFMKKRNLDWSDVRWIGTADGKFYIPISRFIELADKEYNNGYGGNEVMQELVIVGIKDWWMERGEYDGAEWWEFKQKPIINYMHVKEFTDKHTIWYRSIGDLEYDIENEYLED